jgi:hypothetical protein
MSVPPIDPRILRIIFNEPEPEDHHMTHFLIEAFFAAALALALVVLYRTARAAAIHLDFEAGRSAYLRAEECRPHWSASKREGWFAERAGR